MRADWVKGTATGSGGSLAVSQQSPYAGWAEHFGSASAPVPCEYCIEDGAGNYERGYGMWTGESATLARSLVVRTRTSGGTLGSGVPLEFTGAVAVYVAPSVGSAPSVVPGVYTAIQNAYPSKFEWLTSALAPPTTTQTLAAGNTGSGNRGDHFSPFLWLGGRPITKAGIVVSTAGAGVTVRLGLYAMNLDGTVNLATGTSGDTPGQPGALIAEFTTATQIDVSATGVKYVSLVTPLFLAPGWYWSAVASSGVCTVRAIPCVNHPLAMMGIGGGNGSIPAFMANDRSYGAFPSAANLRQYNTPNYPWVNDSGNSAIPALLLSMS